MINDIRILQGAQAVNSLIKHKLIPHAEALTLLEGLKGEEGLALADVAKRAWWIFRTMPETRQTEGTDDPTAHLHYFTG